MIRSCPLCMLAMIFVFVSGSLQAQEIKPEGSNVPPSPTRTPEPVPGAYPAAIKVNYVRTWEPAKGITDPAQVISNTDTRDVRQTTQYFDGLGRPLQTVSRGMAGTSGSDIVAPVVYDGFGREQFQYLPYVVQGTGQFRTSPFVEQASFAPGQYPGESIFYGETQFEPSPLNRVLKTMAPGNSWTGSGNGVSTEYQINGPNDGVKIWDISFNPGAAPTVRTNDYPAGELYKNVTIDEAGNKVVDYKDKEGRVILKKVQLSPSAGDGHTGWLCTYYVYDDLGNLRYVIPPKAVELMITSVGWTVTPQISNELCFRYEYDHRNRMIIKQVPGAAPVEMVYDVRDRLVFSRDGNLRNKNQWLTTLYDDMNRPIMTALYNSAANASQLQAGLASPSGSQDVTYTVPAPSKLEIDHHDGRPVYKAKDEIVFTDGFETPVGTETETELNASGTLYTTMIYSNNPSPALQSGSLDPLTYTFYDRYEFDGARSAEDLSIENIGNHHLDGLPISLQTKGMVTGTKVKLLSGSNQWLTTTTYYDAKGRVRQVLSDNITGGVDVLSTLYNFSGQVVSTKLVHRNPRAAQTPQTQVQTMIEYDHGGRVMRVQKKLNDKTPVDIATNEYDLLGQLKTKTFKRTDGSAIEALNYEYNIRGWLKGINKDYTIGGTGHYFGQELSYDYGFSTNQLNGNIAGIKWRSINDGQSRAYGYSYDRANRLMKADFTQNNGGWNQNAGVNFDVEMGDGLNPTTAYDANGNIKQMQQWGLTASATPATSPQIDNLQYNYLDGGNKLQGVTDGVNDPSTTLGDFKEAISNSTNDYAYDPNGNMISDGNKGITGIIYNHLNLPEEITIPGKGTIRYIYDAAGVKHRKIVNDLTQAQPKDTKTDYLGGMVYENDELQLISHEEGRIRVSHTTGQPVKYTVDYFVKDHLGNVRAVLTEGSEQQLYLASMETERAATENALFNNIESSRSAKPAGYPQDATAGSQNAQVAKLNGNHPDKRIGPSLVLKVMAGDTITIGARAFYKSIGARQDKSLLPAADMATSLLRAFGAGQGSGGHKEAAAEGAVRSPFNEQFINDGYQRMKEKEPANPNQAARPKAYLNFALFDDQFNLVEENSGVKQVKAEPDQLQTLAQDKMVIKTGGFLYVYTSNETPQDVFFDNVVVMNNPGPVLEETHYYPFGLTMAGISARAVYNLVNKNELFQGQPLDDELGLNWYGFKYRNHDPQIGRFIEVDPLSADYTHNSPYAFSENHVTAHVELEGLEKWSIKNGIGETVNLYGPYANQNTAQQHFDDNMTTSGRTLTVTGGFVENNRIASKRVEALERGTLNDVNGVVLHRTASSSTEGTLRAFENGRDGVNYGTHFLVGKGGEILQTASLDSYTLHVGKTRNKTYPTNSNSIGIEVVGNYDYKTQSWEPLTDAQITSTSFLTNSLKMTYNLTNTQVYNHEDISYKTSGEGRVVRSAISQYLVPPPQNTSNNKTPWWMQYITK